MSAKFIIAQDPSVISYINEIGKYPILTAAEEYRLAQRVYEYQDVNSAHTLVTSHLRLVVKISMQMKQYSISLMDLISEGNIGLMYAAKKFNPELGFRFATYAIWWIKCYIQEFIIRSLSLVRVGASVAQRKLFYNFHKAKKAISDLDGLTQNRLIAEKLNVSESDVIEMRDRLLLKDLSLDSQEDGSALVEFIPDHSLNQEQKLSEEQEFTLEQETLKNAMNALTDRERDIIAARKMKKIPLKSLSEKYSVSKERIRQIETGALRKLKRYCLAR